MSTMETLTLPLLPLRDVVVYPHMVIPLFVGRPKSIKALERAMEGDKRIFLVSQSDAGINDPTSKDLHNTGTLSTILQLLKLPDQTVKVLVEGNHRAILNKFTDDETAYIAEITVIEDSVQRQPELEITVKALLKEFEKYVKANKRIPPEILNSLASIDDPGRLADTIAAHVPLELKLKQQILEESQVANRVDLVLTNLRHEIDKMHVDKRVQERVDEAMKNAQREYYLNMKLKAIQEELGDIGEGGLTEIELLEQKIKKSGMNKEAMAKAMAELGKLKMMPPMSAEATVSRNYLDWLIAVPWKKKSKVIKDLNKAEAVLEHDHYGLEKVKERIIEYLAVQQRAKKVKGPILCLVGPPGVGKTSLGESIARATGRTFIRMSLGGIRDEAEIRGHRRTYIGSMPGKILQKMAKGEVKNPLFMLDEVDKMAMDFRGDPASALLEVLDPEQNHAFNDHYMEVDYDLSDVMFVATSNSMNIPAPLLDRMEVLRLPGYTEQEKCNIATRYLVPKQIKQSGMTSDEIVITEGAVRDVIRYYTREAGVRNLERAIAKVCRKVVKEKTIKPDNKKVQVTPNNLEKYLGVKKFRYGLADETDQIGQVTGLAWTEVGGELLKIEAVTMPGKGKITTTGSLGEVMQESIQAAMTVVRTRSRILGIKDEFFAKHDVHVHVPEGATPKDGPSAGVGMCIALISAITRTPIRCDVAMTGEITLRGEVLPIGGLKEKLIAALRGQVKTVIIPEENARELKEIPKNITSHLEIIPVKWIDQVMQIALTYMPQPLGAHEEILPVVKAKNRNKKTKYKRDQAH